MGKAIFKGSALSSTEKIDSPISIITGANLKKKPPQESPKKKSKKKQSTKTD